MRRPISHATALRPSSRRVVRNAVARAQAKLGKRNGKTSRGALKNALRSLTAYERLLGSKRAHRLIADDVRTVLAVSLPGLHTDIQALSTTI